MIQVYRSASETIAIAEDRGINIGCLNGACGG